MSLHYILDGYNIIKCTDALADYSLEEGRNALLKIINCDRPQGSLRNGVTVVFDGQQNVFGSQPGGLARVVFTSGESADEYIKRAVMQGDAKNSVVVSNDREIACYVRKLGAKVMEVDQFMAFLYGSADKSKAHRKSSGSIHKWIPQALEQRINKEFEKIWLKKE